MHKNLLKREVVSEVLQINFYNYSKKKKDVDYFLELYGDGTWNQEAEE